MALTTSITSYLDSLLLLGENIAPDRKLRLQQLADYISQKLESKEEIGLIFICTHNSRRSHMGQIWAQVAAHYQGFARPGV